MIGWGGSMVKRGESGLHAGSVLPPLSAGNSAAAGGDGGIHNEKAVGGTRFSRARGSLSGGGRSNGQHSEEYTHQLGLPIHNGPPRSPKCHEQALKPPSGSRTTPNP